jgi:hypothetical protein
MKKSKLGEFSKAICKMEVGVSGGVPSQKF